MEKELSIAQDDSLLLKEDPNLFNGAAKELIKNAVIEVTIDDLSEGLIVVSFAHDDNLYQGVLLQLNRERGIPCGISFPKDYFTGALESREEQDPLQTPPLNQRHSYFQDRDGGWLDHLSSFKAGHGLRRVIKPPARFKNARSVRPRSRPVLCAKCKVLCDEKASTTPAEESLSQAPEDELKKRAAVAASRAGGVTTRRGKSTMGVTSNTPLSSKDNEVNQDYSYVSVGSKDFIENYWKRPSLEPVLEDSNKIEGSSDTVGVPKLEAGLKDKLSNGVSGSKALSRVPKLKSCGESKLTITLAKDSSSRTLPTLIVSSASGTVKTGFAPSGLTESNKVVWLSENGDYSGKVQWVGKIRDIFHAGVEFDKPIGNSSGIYGYGHGLQIRLFTCKLGYGKFIPVDQLILYEDYYEDQKTGFICIICRDDFIEPGQHDGFDAADKIMVATRCGHLFHQTCLTQWFNEKAASFQQCPFCNLPMERNDTIRIFPAQCK